MDTVNVSQPEFGARLRDVRLRRNLSQRDLAGDLVNPSYISLLERGARVPSLQIVMQLANELSVSVVELIGEQPYESTPRGTAQPGADQRVDESAGARMINRMLGSSARDFGDLASAEEQFGEAYRRARTSGDLLVTVDAGLSLLEVLAGRGDTAARQKLTAELAELTRALGVPEAVVRVDIDRASVARDTGFLQLASDVASAARFAVVDTALAGTSEHVRLLGVLISIRCETGELSDVGDLIQQMFSIVDQLGSEPIAGRAHWVAGVAYAQLDRPAEAADHVRQAAGLLSRPTTSLLDWVRFSRAAAGALLEAKADAELARPYLDQAGTALSLMSLPSEELEVRLLRARLHLAQGRTAEALTEADLDPELLPPASRIQLHLTRSQAYERLQRSAEAIVELRAAARLSEEVGAYRVAAGLWREVDRIRSL